MTLPASVEDLLEGKTANRRTVNLCLDGAIAEQWREAEQKLDIAKRLVASVASEENKKALEEAQAIYDELEPKFEEASREIELKSIGRTPYRELFDAHPPSEKQKRQAKQKNIPEPEFNADTFPPVIIAASLVTPELSVEQVKSMFESEAWNREELNLLTYAAIDVNTSTAVVSLKKGFGLMAG